MEKTNLERALHCVMEEAADRDKPEDLVSRLYTVMMELISKINQVMREIREKERRERDEAHDSRGILSKSPGSSETEIHL